MNKATLIINGTKLKGIEYKDGKCQCCSKTELYTNIIQRIYYYNTLEEWYCLECYSQILYFKSVL